MQSDVIRATACIVSVVNLYLYIVIHSGVCVLILNEVPGDIPPSIPHAKKANEGRVIIILFQTKAWHS